MTRKRYPLRAIITREQMDRMFEEIEGGSDRACAVVAGAYVEECLAVGLSRHLLSDVDALDEAFRPSGLLHSFEAKILTGRLTGMLQSEVYNDIKQVKNIRNLFAHSLEELSFEAPKVASAIEKLQFFPDLPILRARIRQEHATVRQRFIFAVVAISTLLLERHHGYPIAAYYLERFGKSP